MANRITFNSVPSDAFRVKASELSDHNNARAQFVAMGRMLMFEHTGRSKAAMEAVRTNSAGSYEGYLTRSQYNTLNSKFQAEHLLYAAKKACEFSGESAPENFDDFRRSANRFYGNQHFYTVLQGIYQEVVNPILPATYSEAVSLFADVVSVGNGETYELTIGSNDIPVFQDSSWGAMRSIPGSRFYDDTRTLNPTPKTAKITAKWSQIVGNGMDFGRFFANLAAGMYSKTMAMFNQALEAAASDAKLVPAGLQFTFNNTNWMTAANKICALNNVPLGNLFATGSMVPLSHVLPTAATGSTNTALDAALATLLGSDYVRNGYLGEFLGVRLLPLHDAIVPGTQNTNPTTILSDNKIWMGASRGYKPMTVAINSDFPVAIELSPERTSNYEVGIVMTTSIDMVATFASKMALITPV